MKFSHLKKHCLCNAQKNKQIISGVFESWNVNVISVVLHETEKMRHTFRPHNTEQTLHQKNLLENSCIDKTILLGLHALWYLIRGSIRHSKYNTKIYQLSSYSEAALIAKFSCFSVSQAGRHRSIHPMNSLDSIRGYVVSGSNIQTMRWILLECVGKCCEQDSRSYAVTRLGCSALHDPIQSRRNLFRGMSFRIKLASEIYKLLVSQNFIEEIFFMKWSSFR